MRLLVIILHKFYVSLKYGGVCKMSMYNLMKDECFDHFCGEFVNIEADVFQKIYIIINNDHYMFYSHSYSFVLYSFKIDDFYDFYVFYYFYDFYDLTFSYYYSISS